MHVGTSLLCSLEWLTLLEMHVRPSLLPALSLRSSQLINSFQFPREKEDKMEKKKEKEDKFFQSLDFFPKVPHS